MASLPFIPVLLGSDMNVYGRCYMGTVGMGIVYCDKIEK